MRLSNRVSFGYSRALEDRVLDISATVSSGEESKSLDGNLLSEGLVLDSWSRGEDVSIVVKFTARLSRIINDCQLPTYSVYGPASISAVLQWSCPSTSLRGAGTVQALWEGSNQVTCVVPGDQIALGLTISLDIILGKNPVPDRTTTAPFVSGSYLWNYDFKIDLEGIGSTFPTLEVDLTTPGSKHKNDMWVMQIDDDLEVHVTRGCRLLLNVGHPETRKAMNDIASGKSSYATKLWKLFMAIDARSKLLFYAVGRAANEDLSLYQHDDESLGKLLWEMLNLYFPNEDQSKLLSTVMSEPQLISSRVQEILSDPEVEEDVE